jgi:hypothetical protein
MKTIADDQLRATLQSQRFRKVSDIEYVLKQQDEVRQSEGRPGRAPQVRDNRVDNAIRDRFRPKRQDRAYVAQGDEDPGHEDSVYPEDTGEAPLAVPDGDTSDPLDAAVPDEGPDPANMTREELIHEVCRIMGNVGWPNQRPPIPNGGSSARRQFPVPSYPRRDNPESGRAVWRLRQARTQGRGLFPASSVCTLQPPRPLEGGVPHSALPEVQAVSRWKV